MDSEEDVLKYIEINKYCKQEITLCRVKYVLAILLDILVGILIYLLPCIGILNLFKAHLFIGSLILIIYFYFIFFNLQFTPENKIENFMNKYSSENCKSYITELKKEIKYNNVHIMAYKEKRELTSEERFSERLRF